MVKVMVKVLKVKILFFILLVISLFSFCGFSSLQAQNWQPLPPYNTLWPLWSPALSPVDPVTGIATPLVTNLAKTTVLPVQPCLTWDPAWPNPWLLYNTPVGMLFYDPLYGINTWPPDYLLDLAGLPLPIALHPGYVNLPPTSSIWINNTVPIANTTYLTVYPSYAPAAPVPVPLALLLSLLSTGVTTTVPTLPALPPPPSALLGPAAILGTAII